MRGRKDPNKTTAKTLVFFLYVHFIGDWVIFFKLDSWGKIYEEAVLRIWLDFNIKVFLHTVPTEYR
jgi:hypothetical protein